MIRLGLTLLLFLTTLLTNGQGSTLRFVAFGHSYNILNDDDRRATFIDQVNQLEPDYVIVLGDATLGNPSIIEQYANGFNAPIVSVPGNEDLADKTLNKYLAAIGYEDTAIAHPSANMIFMNSSRGPEYLDTFLSEALANDNNRPTLLFTHHRIWDDNLISPNPDEQDKSYSFDQLASLDGRSDVTIIAGNGSGQYFGDQNVRDSSKLNNDNVFWSDIVRGIRCYSVGMSGTRGMATTKATWVLGEVRNGKLSITPHMLEFEEESAAPDLLPIEEPKSESWFVSKLKSKLLWAGILSGLILGFVIGRRRRAGS